MKRYSIVRVDDDYKHICPSAFEKVDDSSFCKLAKRKGGSCNVGPYGDTKEQLIRKVAQVRLKQKIKRWYGPFLKPSKLTIEFVYEKCLEEAKEIVEFLGVEDDKEKRRR